MSPEKTAFTAATVQMVSTADPTENRRTMRRLVDEAAAQGADWIVLPEYWPIMGMEETDKLAHAETDGCGPLQEALAEAAAANRIILFGGSIPLRSDTDGKIYNSLPVYGRNGERLSRYDKVHLFGFTGLGERYNEADTICPGRHIPPAGQADGWHYAQGICYDLRFPEFFRAQHPFDILILPAAFTHTTGQAHWQMLLQARAVENQCYVIASGQGGLHANGRRTFGHSMIIDPWGDILACRPEGEGAAVAEIKPERLNAVRSKLPALTHRRF